jgi:hypothetical protein
MYFFRNKASFYGEELLAPRPHSKPEDHPLSTVHYYLFIYLQLPSIFKAVYPQPEDAPCRADRDRLITDHTAIYRTCTTHKASQYDIISAHLTSPSFKTISLSLRILFYPKLKSSNLSLCSYFTNLTSHVCPSAPTHLYTTRGIQIVQITAVSYDKERHKIRRGP